MAGGGDHSHGGDFRTKVWSMSGGPYCRPVHWKRNTAVALAGIILICIPVALKSAELEKTEEITKFGIKIETDGAGITFNGSIQDSLWSLLHRNSQQRPHLPVHPIPSQLWCKNFGTKDY